MDSLPRLGELLGPDEHRRDAVHIAIAPVAARHRLQPGQRVGLLVDGLGRPDAEWATARSDKTIGIVDPFLRAPVEEGQRFWLFLDPGTATGLRHVWSHPAFQAAAEARAADAQRELLRTLRGVGGPP